MPNDPNQRLKYDNREINMSSVKRLFILATGSILLSSLLPIAALADMAAVKISGNTVFTVHDAANISADQRAQTIQSNLDNALVATPDKSPSAVHVVFVKGTPVITLGGYRVVTVDSNSQS